MQVYPESQTIPNTDRKPFNLAEFDALYERYADAVYANILKLVKQVGDAEDILQEVFVSFWENRHKLQDKSRAGWLFVVSHNKALDHLKRQIKLSLTQIDELADIPNFDSEDADQETLYLEQLKMMKEAVDALPKRKKEVFQLCRMEGRSKDDVAIMMGISTQSVSDYLKQSNKAIKEYIAEHYPYAVIGGLLVALNLTI